MLVFTASGPLLEPDGLLALSLVGAVTDEKFSGAFVAGQGISAWYGLAFGGPFRRGALPGPREPREPDCGALLWTDEATYNSPLGQIRIRIEKYERCVKLYHIDTTQSPPRPIQAYPAVVTPDATTTRGPVTVTAFNHPISDVTVAQGSVQKRSGEVKVFGVEGCANTRIVQYVKESWTIIRTDGTTNTFRGHDWRLDGADPFPGTIPGKNASIDMPGVNPDDIRNIPAVAGLPDGTRIKAMV